MYKRNKLTAKTNINTKEGKLIHLYRPSDLHPNTKNNKSEDKHVVMPPRHGAVPHSRFQKRKDKQKQTSDTGRGQLPDMQILDSTTRTMATGPCVDTRGRASIWIDTTH
ncbi:hypothetical protein HanRHA438_Chr17g0806731 [Helianthus annuus]|nr:hypothetical protein HanRHA438_Chr17g0806731 [Helianthus annuus]